MEMARSAIHSSSFFLLQGTVNVKLANANVSVAGKVIVASVHCRCKSTALIQMVRSAVEEELVCVENASALIPAILAICVNSALLVEQCAMKSGMSLVVV